MVLDTSACLDIVLDTEPGRALHEILLDPERALLAPGLLWVEVARVLRAKVIDGALSRLGAEAALADFLDLGAQEISVEPLLVRAWQLRDLRLADAARRHTQVAVVTHLHA